MLEEHGCAWELETPGEEDARDVPIKLKKQRLHKALMMVTEMYSLPSYDGVDPNR
jgi:V/A-type H+-transporting ATPase subunit I